MLRINRYELVYRLLITYIYIVLFGGFGLKLIGFPTDIGLALISFLDIIPLIVWIISNPVFRIKEKRFFVDTLNFWLVWIFILLLLIAVTFSKGGSSIPVLVHWGAMIRYIPLAMIVISLNKRIDVNKRIINHIKIISVIILVICYICYAIGPERALFFLPLLPENATGERETLVGNFSAIFANTVDLGFLLVSFYIIYIYKFGLSKTKEYFLTIIYLIAVFKTGSAIATAVFIFIAFFRLTQQLKNFRYVIIALVVTLFSYLGYTYWDLVMLVVDNTRLSRLGMLTLTGPDFISEFSLDTFFGVGLDGNVVFNKVNSYAEDVHMLEKSSPSSITSVMGDVYWIALLVYQGLVGLCLIVFLYYNLFKETANKLYIDNNYDYSQIIKWFNFCLFIFAFLNQIIVIKTFSIVFWIFLAVTYTKIKVDENTSNQQL